MPLVDGVTLFDGVTVLDGVVMVDGIGVDGVPIDGVVVDGETCEMAGLRSVGTSGRDVTVGCVGLTRTRSPSGIPWTIARSLGGRGTANTKSDAAASAAR